MVDRRHPVVVGKEAALAFADGNQGYIGELGKKFRYAVTVQASVERRHDRGRTKPRGQETDGLQVRVDDVECWRGGLVGDLGTLGPPSPPLVAW